jgi:predicted nucleotidyltransferase
VGGRIGAAELHSRLLHEQVAKKLVRDPALKAQAIKRLEFLQKANPSGRIYHVRWAKLLESDMPKLLRTMTEDSEQAAALRRESPFTIFFRGTRQERDVRPHLEFSRSELARLCRRRHVRRLSLFGSAVRADFRPDSDVDVLVEFEPQQTPALGEMTDMRDELSALFGGRKVDLATPAILRNPYRRKAIERDLETVYAAK